MTSTPQRRISSRRQSLKASTPNFTVQYGERRGDVMRPRILTIFIMRPIRGVNSNTNYGKGNHDNGNITVQNVLIMQVSSQ
jgi:hypothetical protein